MELRQEVRHMFIIYAEKCIYDRIAARMKEVLERKTA